MTVQARTGTGNRRAREPPRPHGRTAGARHHHLPMDRQRCVLYKWFRRDRELGGRQSFENRWSQWRYHETAREHSFPLLAALPPRLRYPREPFVCRLRKAHRPGRVESLAVFSSAVHRWATRATANASHVILLEYPDLPFRGEYPLSDLHQRLAAAAGHRSGRSPRSQQTDASVRTRRRSSPVTGRSEGETQASEASSSHSGICPFGAASTRSRFGYA